MLHLSPGPMSPRCTTFIITRTLSSLRPAALPGMVDGVSESPGLGCPCSPPHPCPSEPQGGSPNLSRGRAWSLAQACPSLLLEQLPGTLANGGPLSMMQREALPGWPWSGPGICWPHPSLKQAGLEMEIVTYTLQETRREVCGCLPHQDQACEGHLFPERLTNGRSHLYTRCPGQGSKKGSQTRWGWAMEGPGREGQALRVKLDTCSREGTPGGLGCWAASARSRRRPPVVGAKAGSRRS